VIQVYCDSEMFINKWLKEHPNVEVIDIKMSTNHDGELIMVVYKESKQNEVV